MKINRQNVQNLRAIINEQLKSIAEEQGVTLEVTNCSYGENSFTFKMEGGTIDEAGNVIDSKAEYFLANAGSYGLSPDDLGSTFVSNSGLKFKIIGLKSRARKYPIITSNLDNGRNYKHSVEQVKRGLENRNK